jgi:hypothetical protein
MLKYSATGYAPPTYINRQKGSGSFLLPYLEEAAEPPDLEERLADDHADYEEVPPFYPAVG